MNAAAGAALSVLLGWLAGGLANWSADVLPHVRPGVDAALARRSAVQPVNALLPLHYLTLPWHFFRGGACPHCGRRRSLRAPLLELAMIAAFVLGWFLLRGSGWALAAYWSYAAFLLAVIVVDLEHRRVLNVMLAPAAAAALPLSLRPGGPGLLSALLGAALGLALFGLIALIGRGAMGLGDVKLAGVIGLMTGYPSVVAALLAGAVLGGLAALVLLATRRVSRKSAIAYAPYLALGAIVVLLLTA